MGNCCARTKNQTDKTQKNKEQSELKNSSSLINSSKQDLRQQFKEKCDTQIYSQLSQEDISISDNSRLVSSQHSETKNEQQQIFQDIIYLDKMREIKFYLQFFENCFEQVSKDLIDQITVFCHQMDFLLNSKAFTQSQTPHKINTLNLQYTQFLQKYYEFTEKQFRSSLRTNNQKAQQSSSSSENKEFQTQTTDFFLSPKQILNMELLLKGQSKPRRVLSMDLASKKEFTLLNTTREKDKNNSMDFLGIDDCNGSELSEIMEKSNREIAF